jgi:N-acetylmuramic acid 6-phosphate etherase
MESAAEFLATGKKFHLGYLETEKPNPKTIELSMLVQNDLNKAIQVLAEVDVSALDKIKNKTTEILQLRKDIQATWRNGGRIFLCGCGATGRLSLTLETLFREEFPDYSSEQKVISFMAGGDVALVHSLEGFEDFPTYGERHLLQLGFKKNDLLIASTEGGETPYVIGATEAAANMADRAPYFLYCNPDEILCAHVERSRKVIENPKIKKVNLTVGPMALAGSTRMQASTVLQLTIGFALLTSFSETEISEQLDLLKDYMAENAVAFLRPFIELEAAEYSAGRFIIYKVQDYAITVFTDTTERAPTFSLTPFSHRKAERLLKMKPSLSFLSIPATKTAVEAWAYLLKREPRALNWSDVDLRTDSDYLSEFDFSREAKKFRAWLTQDAEHSDFEIFRHQNTLHWRLQNIEQSIIWPEASYLLFEHTALKMFLNIHSTLVMGLLGRYKRNLMTWVHPTNGKLIDRSARYIQTLLKEDGFNVSYDEIIYKIFDLKKRLTGNESIVLTAYSELANRT